MTITPQLFLVRGLPGSGKTTFVEQTKRDDDCHFEADMFFIGNDGLYRFDPDRIKDAHAWCHKKTVKYLAFGFRVWVSNTFVRLWELEAYINIGVPTTVLTMEGSYGSTHGVSEAQMASMWERWENYSGPS